MCGYDVSRVVRLALPGNIELPGDIDLSGDIESSRETARPVGDIELSGDIEGEIIQIGLADRESIW